MNGAFADEPMPDSTPGADTPNTNPMDGSKDVDLYELLGVPRSASQAEIKKAYRKAALQHHPDKVAPDQREASEVQFKAATQAYEILRDEEKRHLYDTHGMAAFERGGGMGADGVDLNDILGQMFGMNVGGQGRGGGPKRPKRGPSEEQEYKVTLEDLYKGKTVKFAANKKVVCSTCKGTGAKDKVEPHECEKCKGAGMQQGFQQIGPGLVRQVQVECKTCGGSGMEYKEKDRCKKCKGKRVVEEVKPLEIYIPRGSQQGEHIILEGEADQFPGQEPGDIVFTLVEEPHERFTRMGADLSTDLEVTLAEALSGFSRVVLKHLDGRGLHINFPEGKILKPNEVLKVAGEGMPMKKGELKGDLYLVSKIKFPEDGWLKDEAQYKALQDLLPPAEPPIDAEETDEVEYEVDVDIDQMGASGHGHGADWEDMDEEGGGAQQCATQ